VVHLLYFSFFYHSPFLMVVSTGLKILHSLLYREYINHIHLFFLLPSLIYDLLFTWPVLHNIAVFVLGPYSMRENMWLLAFWTWLTSLKMMFSSHFVLLTHLWARLLSLFHRWGRSCCRVMVGLNGWQGVKHSLSYSKPPLYSELWKHKRILLRSITNTVCFAVLCFRSDY
jgi:hypothetical protein